MYYDAFYCPLTIRDLITIVDVTEGNVREGSRKWTHNLGSDYSLRAVFVGVRVGGRSLLWRGESSGQGNWSACSWLCPGSPPGRRVKEAETQRDAPGQVQVSVWLSRAAKPSPPQGASGFPFRAESRSPARFTVPGVGFSSAGQSVGGWPLLLRMVAASCSWAREVLITGRPHSSSQWRQSLLGPHLCLWILQDSQHRAQDRVGRSQGTASSSGCNSRPRWGGVSASPGPGWSLRAGGSGCRTRQGESGRGGRKPGRWGSRELGCGWGLWEGGGWLGHGQGAAFSWHLAGGPVGPPSLIRCL